MNTTNCTICGKKIVLVPSAAERAAKDVTGKSAAYYTSLFTEHAACILAKRNADTSALIARSYVLATQQKPKGLA